jgi:hypothetical protein
VTAGTRPALFFAVAVVFAGSLLSLLIPEVGPVPAAERPPDEVEAFEAFEPVDPAAAVLDV